MPIDLAPAPRTRIVSTCLLLALLAGVLTAQESLESRRERLERMSAVEKESLRKRQAQFEQLPDDEQARLRQLHEQLLTDPQQAELRRILNRYEEWLKLLPSTQRAELLQLPLDRRLEEIKRIIRGQEAARFAPLANALKEGDVQVIADWVDQFVLAHEEEITATVPEYYRPRLEAIEDPQRRRILLYGAHRKHAEKPLVPTSEDVQRLQQALSPSAGRILQEQKTLRDQHEVIARWVGVIIFAKMMTQVPHEELQAFFNEKLSAQQRDYLESMPLDRMRIELTRMYLKDRFERFERPPHHGGSKGFPDGRGRRGDGPPGPPGRGPGPPGRPPGPRGEFRGPDFDGRGQNERPPREPAPPPPPRAE